MGGIRKKERTETWAALFLLVDALYRPRILLILSLVLCPTTFDYDWYSFIPIPFP